MSLWSTTQSRGLWRSDAQWSFGLDPSHSELSGSLNPACGYFPGFGMHNWNRNIQ